jgi:allantoinase
VTESADYRRDIVRYGPNPPNPQWPGRANIAVQFVLNYEEGAEDNVLHGDRRRKYFSPKSLVHSRFRTGT